MDLLGCADDNLQNHSLMKYWSSGMGNNPFTESFRKMMTRNDKSTGLYPLITSFNLFVFKIKSTSDKKY